ncbi:MAG: HD domain-containing protein [Eubacterium sp.]|nr:HD domain-containing protein [Eubacterium sp.]
MNLAIAKVMQKLIADPDQNQRDIDHFMKVYAFAETIGHLEGVNDETQQVLEIAAILHDIACPLCREKYGNTDGAYQQKEGMPLAKAFLQEFDLPQAWKDRVIWLVGHHHTYTNVEGMDYQILLEADYLVNAGESPKFRKQMDFFRKKVFRTKSGCELLCAMFGQEA